MRSLPTRPILEMLQRATSPNRMLAPMRPISSGVLPEAYAAATMEPALTPAM